MLIRGVVVTAVFAALLGVFVLSTEPISQDPAREQVLAQRAATPSEAESALARVASLSHARSVTDRN